LIPDELQEDMQVLTTIISATMDNIGILIMGENIEPHLEGQLSVIRIYLLGRDDSEFLVEKELEAFAFHDLDSAHSFLENLPNMTALELLIMMNRTDDDSSNNDGSYYLQ